VLCHVAVIFKPFYTGETDLVSMQRPSLVPEQVTPRSMELASNPSLRLYDRDPRQHLPQPFPGARHHPLDNHQPPPSTQRPPAPHQQPPNSHQHPQAPGMYTYLQIRIYSPCRS